MNTYTENQLTVYSLKGQVSRFLSILDLLQVIFITSFQSIKSNERKKLKKRDTLKKKTGLAASMEN